MRRAPDPRVGDDAQRAEQRDDPQRQRRVALVAVHHAVCGHHRGGAADAAAHGEQRGELVVEPETQPKPPAEEEGDERARHHDAERRPADLQDLADREPEAEPGDGPAEHRPLRHAHAGRGPRRDVQHGAQRHPQQDHQQQRGQVQRVLDERHRAVSGCGSPKSDKRRIT